MLADEPQKQSPLAWLSACAGFVAAGVLTATARPSRRPTATFVENIGLMAGKQTNATRDGNCIFAGCFSAIFSS